MIRMRELKSVTMIAALMAVGVAHADLINCAALSANPGDYKVVLDDFAFISVPASNKANVDALRDRLQFNLNGQLDALRLAAQKLNLNLQVPMRLVFCTGRRPSVSGSEFTDVLAERLSDNFVVVEVWGSLDLSPASRTDTTPRAIIGYVIPPVQHYVPASQLRPIQIFTYAKSHGGGLEEQDNLPELSAIALVGLGTKAARASHYDLAVWAFTRAELGIADAKIGGTNADVDSLLRYVKLAACQTRAQAKVDAVYSGALKGLPPQSCTGAP
jgi:hypothetical protein